MTADTLQQHLDRILQWTGEDIQQPSPSFEWTTAAADHNARLLEQHDWCLASLLETQRNTPLYPGSEFRPAELIDPLVNTHPLWSNVKAWLRHGVSFPLKPIPETERRADLAAILARGNHKGAITHYQKLKSVLQDEVARGWQLIIPKHAVTNIPQAVIAPLNIVEQDTINEQGEIIPKNRITHDQSFNVIPNTHRSVNDRVITEELMPCQFGSAIQCHIARIIELRRQHPREPIFQTKVDYKSAYRLLHCHPDVAVQSITVLDEYALIAQRLTFGGRPNPSRWSDLSELACDLANDLVRHPGWDHAKYTSRHQRQLQPPQQLPSDVPFAPALPTMMPKHDDNAPTFTVYIDDTFGTVLERYATRGMAIFPFVIDLLSRPVTKHEPLPRDDNLSLSKFVAEAKLEETKMIVGWLVDTRRLMLSLPQHKVISWSNTIHDILRADCANHETIDRLVGRLNHCGFVIPMSRHFLGRIRRFKYVLEAKPRYAKLRLPRPVQADLKLWLQFLQKAKTGINMNLREATHHFKSDACTHGIGGVDWISGRAWRIELPTELRLRATLNCLEFLAAYITIKLAFHYGDIQELSVIEAITDSTATASWLIKSSFTDAEPFHQHIARSLATSLIDNDCSLSAT